MAYKDKITKADYLNLDGKRLEGEAALIDVLNSCFGDYKLTDNDWRGVIGVIMTVLDGYDVVDSDLYDYLRLYDTKAINHDLNNSGVKHG